MTTANAISSNKAARGAKHTCQECEVRFYDLLRNPIVCPSCGAVHIPAVQPAMDAGRRAAPAGKTGWRQSVKRPSPVLPEAVPEDAVRPEAAAADDIESPTRLRRTISCSIPKPMKPMSPTSSSTTSRSRRIGNGR
jgi:hypothetical protein